MKAVKTLLTVLLCMAMVALSGGILGTLLLFGSGQTGSVSTVETDLEARYGNAIHNQLADALAGIASVKKTYWIAADAPAAPEPDPQRYGTTDDPQSLGWLLEEAKDVLEGQDTYFSTEVTLLPGSEVHYYLDETILAITWKQVIDELAVTFSEVKIMDPSQFRRYLAGDSFGSGKLMLTTEMSQTVNAVVACSADYYGYRPDGTVVLDGVGLRTSRSLPDQCYIDSEGNLQVTVGESFGDLEELQKYVDENRIRFSLSFGPTLVQDGEVHWRVNYPIGEMDRCYARAGIGQLDKLHYLYLACNRDGEDTSTPDIIRFAKLFASTGCRQAYNLDGGQTATVVMDNEVINQVNYGSQRRISDIIYFATAKPKEE